MRRRKRSTHLVVLGGKLVEALLNDMIPVQVLDECHDMKTERDDNGMNLETTIGYPYTQGKEGAGRTWRRVDRKSIIFCTARVPCIFNEMLTRSCATDSQIRFRCSSVENSRSFWQR